MSNAVTMCNLGLAKLGAQRVNDLSPPRAPLEKHCAEGYPYWRKQELMRKRWRFAIERATLALSETLTGVDQPYKFAKPTACLRLIRRKSEEWEERGGFVYSAFSTLTVEYIKDKSEAEFDPLFVDVLACRVALECVEAVTQSNTKAAVLERRYNDALNDAALNNAFVNGPEDIQSGDGAFSWLDARYGYEGP